MKRHLVSVTMLLVAAACGGSEKPPQVAREPAAEGAAPKPPEGGAPAPSATASEGQAAASSSDDVTKGVAAMKTGNYSDARASFDAAIKKNSKQADAHYYLGVVMDKMGDKGAAEKEYKDALASQPDLQEAAENLTAIFIDTQRWDDAVALAKRALAKNAKNSEMQLNYAVALAGKGDQEGAAKAFDHALELAPNDARFYLAYARELTGWKKRDEALAKLKQAQRVAGDDAALLGTIGFELRMQRAVPECLAAFDKAISLKDNADFRTNRALCKMAAKDRAGALADLKEATTKEPGFALAHYWYGLNLHEDAKFAEAAAQYEAYLKAAPNGPMVRAAEAKLKFAKEKKKAPPPPAKGGP